MPGLWCLHHVGSWPRYCSTAGCRGWLSIERSIGPPIWRSLAPPGHSAPRASSAISEPSAGTGQIATSCPILRNSAASVPDDFAIASCTRAIAHRVHPVLLASPMPALGISQRSLQIELIFRLLLKITVERPHECDFDLFLPTARWPPTELTFR